MEAERKDLDEYVKKQDTEIGMIKGNLSDLMTENVVLKNAVKVQKKQVSASNMQTENLGTLQSDCGVQTDDQKPVTEKADCETCVQSFMTGFGIDFGIDTGTQTDPVHETAQGDCKRCVSNVELINELIELLGIIEKNIVYAQSVGFQQDMKELVTRLGKVEEEISWGNRQRQRGGIPLNKAVKALSTTVYPSGTGYIPSIQDTALQQMNHFQPLQHVNNNPFKSNSVPEDIPVRPGNDTYSEVVKNAGQKVSVFSTSITKGVDVNELNKKYVGNKARIHRFHGKKARHLKHYIPVHMREDKPDVCVIVGGGNDLPENTPVLQVANELMEAGITCKRHGASKIVISSVLPRSMHESKRAELNRLLYDLCVIHNFVFMDNWNMSLKHISPDGVHLNKSGDQQLLFNLLWYLNA